MLHLLILKTQNSMAQVVTISVCAREGVALPATVSYAFPVQSILLKPATGTFNGVSVLTEIVYQQKGLNVHPESYYSGTALATIATACNA